MSRHGSDDCMLYYNSTCYKGNSCQFRHEPSALTMETTCKFWMRGDCKRFRCIFRHAWMPRKDRSQHKCHLEVMEGRCSRPYCPFRHDTVEPPRISGPSAVPPVAPYTVNPKTGGSRTIMVRRERRNEISLSSPPMANSTFIDGRKENLPKWVTRTINIKKGLTPQKICHQVEANNNKESEVHPPIRTKLHDAAENGNLSAFKSMMQNMLDDSVLDVEDFNPEDGEGQTPFHLAAKHGHLEICRLIIANITDKNPINDDGETPLQLATFHGHLAVMELIKSALSKRIKRG